MLITHRRLSHLRDRTIQFATITLCAFCPSTVSKLAICRSKTVRYSEGFCFPSLLLYFLAMGHPQSFSSSRPTSLATQVAFSCPTPAAVFDRITQGSFWVKEEATYSTRQQLALTVSKDVTHPSSPIDGLDCKRRAAA